MNYIVDNDAIHWITILRMLFASVGATCIKDFQCWLLHFPLKWWSLLWYLAVLSIGVTQLLGRVTITTIGSITTIASGATSMATGFAFAIGLLTKFTCKFCLVGRCRCACEAKLEEDLGQFILYIHAEYSAALYKIDRSRYLSFNKQDFQHFYLIHNAIETVPINPASEIHI